MSASSRETTSTRVESLAQPARRLSPWHSSHIDAWQLVMRIPRINNCMSSALNVFGAMISFQKAHLVDLTNDGPLSATHGFHSFVTSAQLHHFPYTRLRLSRSGRIWLGDYGNSCRNPTFYS